MERLICSRTTQRLGALAALWLLAAPGLAAQTGSIAGRVIDSGNGQPIPAAQVFVADLDIGVLSQQNGSYLLQNVPAGPRTVTVQRIGYRQVAQTVTVAAGQTAVLDFRIAEEALALDEIVITGTPGGTQRRAIGNTVAQVEVAAVTQDLAISNMQDLLSGRTPGISFSRLSGNVGTGSPVKIRGVGSFTLGANPLVYVDGVRVNNDANAGPTIGVGSATPGQGGDVNVLDDFNPEDIESIEVIKGPAAAAIYGTEASAGVIQIITKKGLEGAPEFNISIRQGTNFFIDPAGRLGQQWTCDVDPTPGAPYRPATDVTGTPRPGVGTSGADAIACNEESELTPYNMYDAASRYIRDGYVLWPSENLYSHGHSQSYNLDVRGGTQSIRYFLSANYDDEQGYEFYNTDETFRLRGNMGVVFSDRFSLDLSTGYVEGDTRFAAATLSDGGVWQDLIWSNGYYQDWLNPFEINYAGSTFDPNPRLGGFQEHLPQEVEGLTSATREYSRFTGAATLNFNSGEASFGNAVASLHSRAVVGIDKGWDINTNFFPNEEGTIPQYLYDYCSRQGRTGCDVTLTGTPRWPAQYSETVDGEMTYARPITSNYSFDYSLTADVDVAETWSFATSVGTQYYIRETETFENTGQGFASPLSRTINQLSPSRVSNSYSLITNKSLGLYVNEEIGWNDRIFVTGTLRYDDNSTFGEKGAGARYYPKLSATWVLSEESFWNVDPINSLRLRGAWGKAGRQPSSLAQYNRYAAEPGPGGNGVVRAQAPGNSEINPEVSTEIETGFDIALLDDRLSGEFTYYKRWNKDVLYPIPLAASYGFPGNVDRNVGEIQNWGWEAQLSARLYEGDAISVDLDLAGSYTMNEVTDLSGMCTVTATGEPSCYTVDAVKIGLPFPFQKTSDWVREAAFDDTAPACTPALIAAGTLCTDQTNAFDQRLWARCDPGRNLAPAGVADTLQYGRVPTNTTAPCQTIPDRDVYAGPGFAPYTWSVAPRINVFDNQLQIFALAEGQYGRVSEDNGHTWGHIYRNSKVSRLQDDPIWVYSQIVNGQSSEDWTKGFYDADFWKLREVGARYNLPESLVERTGASRASLAFSARNIWTIWVAQEDIYGLPVTDPEYGTPTVSGDNNFWEQPSLASMNVTLRVTF